MFCPATHIKSLDMGTASRGNAAEAAVLAALIRSGFNVLVPFGDGHPYDLAVDLGPTLLRVQCKRAWSTRGCIVFNSRSTDHGRGPRSYRGLADIFAVYFPPTEGVYLVPMDGVAECEGRLRLEPARNNQRKRTRPAADFALDRWSVQTLCEVAFEARAAAEPDPSFA
jgi:hypothetical protein